MAWQTEGMPQVRADNEEVVFQEGIPEHPRQIYELLMGAFAEQRRSVVKFIVDGEDCMQGANFPESFELIEAHSLSHDEITMRLAIQFFNQMSNLDKEIQAYQGNVLRTPWSEVFKQMDKFIEKIQPFADLIDHTLPYAQSYSPPWRSEMEEIAKRQADALESVLQSFEKADSARLSDVLNNLLLPLFRETNSLFSNQIIPFLGERVDSEKKGSSDA